MRRISGYPGKYWKQLLLFAVLTLGRFAFTTASAQDPIPDFSFPLSACLNQNIEVQNQSMNATSFEWDFCQGDLAQTPSASNPFNLAGSGANISIGVGFISENGLNYAFFCGLNSNSLTRVDFGADLNNSSPLITNLGTLGGALSGPQDVAITKDGANFYGFVSNRFGNRLTRLSFGSSLTNTPTADVILSGSAPDNTGLDLAFDGTNWVVILTNNFNITLVNFHSSLASSVTGADVLETGVIPDANAIGDISLARDANGWFGLMPSINNGKLLRASFGTALFVTPAFADITNGGIGSSFNPCGIWVAYEGGKYQAFVSTSQGNLIRYDFGSDLGNNSPVSADLTGLGVLSNTLKITGARIQSRFFLLSSSWQTNDVFKISFPETCSFNYAYSTLQTPPVVTSQRAATTHVTLYARSPSGVTESITKEITISTLIAPNPEFISTGVCANNDVAFATVEPALTYSWSFGDGNFSVGPNPVYDYSASGNYMVTLELVGSNACTNTKSEIVKIYDAPNAEFAVPLSLLCTNDEVIFVNEVADVYDGNLTYEWSINATPAAVTRDLEHTFTSGGMFSIKLKTSIPGCSAELTQNTSTVLEGPVVDFSYDGTCEQQPILFASAIQGSINSLSWDFDAQHNSTEQNPQFTFSNFGDFDVTLSVVSANGCNTETTQRVTISQKPAPDFSIQAPPSSCSGSPSTFTDLTPSLVNTQIESWQWNFADGGSNNDQNPNHTFQNAGNYNVELIVTSDAGCANSIVKPVTILQSPSISFENSPACLNKPTSFTSSSDNAVQYYWEVGASLFETQNINYSFNATGAQPVKLSVVGANDCVATITKDIIVPMPVSPTFTVTNNCTGYESRFVSLSAGNDPVVSRLWDFAGQGTSTDINPTFTFASAGNKNVSLQVTTASGCVYQRQELVSVIAAPLADFSFSPGFGVPPQEISFNNQSLNATSFAWNFDDGNSSTQQSPKHTFLSLGDFNVKLSASNAAGCENSVSKVVSMVASLPDVDLNLMTISANPDGTLKVIVTIANKGNTMIRNLPVRLDVSGQVTLETIVTETIPPFSMYNLVLNYTIAQTKDLEFLCAATTLEGDLHPEGNRICNQLQSDLAIITPYPNPAKDLLTLEWVAQGGEEIELTVIDARGQTVLSYTDISTAGLNQKSIDLQNVHSGVYILRILTSKGFQTHRILVSN